MTRALSLVFLLLLEVPAYAADVASSTFTLAQATGGRPTRAERSSSAEESYVLGRFVHTDPRLLGRIWRIGRDPRTCVGAHFYGLLYERAQADLSARLAREETAPLGDRRPQSVVPYESAIVDALLFDGRHADAERFLKERLARPIYPADYASRGRTTPLFADEEQARRRHLTERLAEVYTTSRPAEAERLYRQIIEEQTRSSR